MFHKFTVLQSDFVQQFACSHTIWSCNKVMGNLNFSVDIPSGWNPLSKLHTHLKTSSIFHPEKMIPFFKLPWIVCKPQVPISTRGGRSPSRCSFIILKNFRFTLRPSKEIWINLDWSSASMALLNLVTNWSAFAPSKNSEFKYRVTTKVYLTKVQHSTKFSSYDITC